MTDRKLSWFYIHRWPAAADLQRVSRHERMSEVLPFDGKD